MKPQIKQYKAYTRNFDMALFQLANNRGSIFNLTVQQFQKDQKKAAAIQEAEGKILFWKKCKKEAKQEGLNKKYLNDVEAEIEYLEDVIKYGGNKENDDVNAHENNDIKQVARKIKSQTKSGDATYSETDIIFALNCFKENYRQSKNYTDIYSLIREDEKCSPSLRPEKANKAMLRWFHIYEKETGITLKD